MGDIRSVIDWLIDGARSAEHPEELPDQLCRRLVEAGIPLWRVGMFVYTLHPDQIGRAFVWQVGAKLRISSVKYGVIETEEYLHSPVRAVFASRKPLRRHLAAGDCPNDFPVLHEFRAEGATDYAAFPLLFLDGSVHIVTFTTQQPGGFTPEEFACIEAVITPLTRAAEIRALKRTATNLLDTYVGRQAGERIMAGEIRRGHVEDIRAAIWLSDMRGFTMMAEQLPPQELIGLLNRYFDCQVPAIFRHGGEVLKFIGDGLLAIFPLPMDEEKAIAVCRGALLGAREARTQIDALEAPRSLPDGTHIRFGLALHVGEVMYGNIGGGGRLDFTCIGRAVNLAARIEKVAARHGHTIVASAAFAAFSQHEFTPLGEFDVAGFAAPQPVFGLADSQ